MEGMKFVCHDLFEFICQRPGQNKMLGKHLTHKARPNAESDVQLWRVVEPNDDMNGSSYGSTRMIKWFNLVQRRRTTAIDR